MTGKSWFSWIASFFHPPGIPDPGDKPGQEVGQVRFTDRAGLPEFEWAAEVQRGSGRHVSQRPITTGDAIFETIVIADWHPHEEKTPREDIDFTIKVYGALNSYKPLVFSTIPLAGMTATYVEWEANEMMKQHFCGIDVGDGTIVQIYFSLHRGKQALTAENEAEMKTLIYQIIAGITRAKQ